MSGYPPPAQSSTRARGGARAAETPTSLLLERVGAGLGVLMFVWGFLPWYGLSATTVHGFGFGSPAPVVIGMSLLASGVAAARAVDQKSASSLVPLAAAAAALLVAFGLIVDRGDNVALNVGLILALVTSLLQTAAFVLGWLYEIGRLRVTNRPAHWASTPHSYRTASEVGYGAGSSAYSAPTYGDQSGYAQAGYSAPPGYGQVPASPQGTTTPYAYPPAGTASTYPPSASGYTQRHGQPGAGPPYPAATAAQPPAPTAPTAPTSFGQHSLREPDEVDGTKGPTARGR
jgi:hypothetical protein